MKFNEVVIDVHHIPPLDISREAPSLHKYEKELEIRPLHEMMEQYEAEIIEQALRKYNNNKTAAARALGISIRNLYYKLEKYGIDKKSTQ